MLEGLKKRFGMLGSVLEAIICDNTKIFASTFKKVFPYVIIFEDPRHAVQRYGGGIKDGAKSLHYQSMLVEASNCIYLTKATPNVPAVYRPVEDQIRRLHAFFTKWQRAGCWNAAALALHTSQLKLVAQGRLSHNGELSVLNSI